jgi:hypothetical protein
MGGRETGATRPLAFVVALAALVFGLLMWWANYGGSPWRVKASTVDCRTRYAAAHSFRDTATVDLSYPAAYWEQTSSRRGPRTCGELRTFGQLR